ncbi:MAG TPA: LPS-assembly protein LptD [Gallionellaceae bacterium]|nr:LPS-assembly protein LptD [Gallionellaceae bacterium]
MRHRIKLATLAVLSAFSPSSPAQEQAASGVAGDAVSPPPAASAVTAAPAASVPAAPRPAPSPRKKAGGTGNSPIVITADRMEAHRDQELEATGDVELKSDDYNVSADHLRFLQGSKELTAEGKVRVQQQGATVTGNSLKMNVDTFVGDVAQPEFTFSDTRARGSADNMHMQGKKNYVLEDARYTTCPIGNNDWFVRMSELELDRNTQIGQAHNARIVFKDVPIFYTPWMDFPLDNRRKSGFLGPVFGSTTSGGSEITVPFYWNIASNMDATLAPRVMDKRGTLYNNEFRYMSGYSYSELNYDTLADDQVTHSARTHSALRHAQNFGGGFGGTINYNAVSDDAYYRDLGDSVNTAAQKNLLQEGTLSYSAPWWSSTLRVQRYQTLQDPAAPVVAPYQRLPQLNLAAQQVMGGASLAMNAEYVDFSHPALVNGNRVVLNPSVSYPLLRDPAYYVTPKVSVHNTQYTLGVNNTGPQDRYERTLPIYSLDSGMTLEREFNTSSSEYVQTLEPRLYYVYIPYVNQDMLPNFDTAQAPFTFTQMFMENRFFGSDRIGDANQVTMALTSRLLDADTGNERLRVALGERFNLETPRVNLVAPNQTTNRSDILLSVGGRVSRALTLDSLVQYNPNDSRSEMYNVSARYAPEPGKVFNFGYRYTRDALLQVDSMRQVDFSTQWLLGGRWHAVARYNYSLLDQRAVEVLAGLEYSQDCWMVRMVGQQFATATNQTSTGLFLQLELNELIRVGPDPLAALRQSVPGYTKLNEIPSAQTMQGARTAP